MELSEDDDEEDELTKNSEADEKHGPIVNAQPNPPYSMIKQFAKTGKARTVHVLYSNGEINVFNLWEKNGSAKKGSEKSKSTSEKKAEEEGKKSRAKNKSTSKDDDTSGAELDDMLGFGGDGMLKNLSKQFQASKVGSTVEYTVSPPIINTATGQEDYVVISSKLRNVSFQKAPLTKLLFGVRREKPQTPFHEESAAWIETLDNFKMIPPHGINRKYHRTGGKRNTQDLQSFVVTLPIVDKDRTIHEVLDNIMKESFQKVFKKRAKTALGHP